MKSPNSKANIQNKEKRKIKTHTNVRTELHKRRIKSIRKGFIQ